MPDRPTSAIVAVIDRCDGRCIMCNIWKSGRPGEIKAPFFNKLPESLKSINITGGEPFLRDDLPDVIDIIKRRCHNPRMVISTNGIRTEAIKEQMANICKISRKVGVRVSIDGVGEMHDRIRGMHGAYQKCLATIKTLQSIPVKDMGISFTILSIAGVDNTSEIRKVYRLSREMGVEFAITTTLNSGFFFKTGSNASVAVSERLRKELQYVISQELMSFHPKRWGRAYYTKGLYEYIAGKRVLAKCGAASSFFFLSAQGELYPCHILDEKCGDLKISSFEDVWHLNHTSQIRELATNCPHKCWMTCTVGKYFRDHILMIIWWIVRNKLKAHWEKYSL